MLSRALESSSSEENLQASSRLLKEAQQIRSELVGVDTHEPMSQEVFDRLVDGQLC